jgi:hypothetical protein
MEDPSKVIVQDLIAIDRIGDRWHRVLWKGQYRRLLRLGPNLNLNVEDLRSWRGIEFHHGWQRYRREGQICSGDDKRCWRC